MFKILTINPGSTSTKIAVFHDEEQVFKKNIKHSAEEIAKFDRISDQKPFRTEVILNELKEAGIDIKEMTCLVGRGGLMHPLTSGVYEVNEPMIRDLTEGTYGEHASNLGGLIAHDIACEIGVKAYIADPVVVDEMDEVARYSGHPLFPRISIFHALNQKAIAKTYAAQQGAKYEDLNLIVVHLGGGTSVSAHCKGRVIDTNNALNGDGPFSPERSGGLPAQQLADLCFSGKYTAQEVKKMINGRGGTVAHLGTNDFLEIEHKMVDDPHFKLIADAYLYNIAKEIGAMAAVLKGKVNAILVTGGIAYGKGMMADLATYVDWIAPVKIYPGEDEMGALAHNGLSVMQGREVAKVY